MRAVRRFFGSLCGGSGAKKDSIDDSPVERPKDENEKAAEPTILPCEVKIEEEEPPALTLSSCESLNGSPSIHQEGPKADSITSVQKIYGVLPMKPEFIDMITADRVFNNAVDILDSFVKECNGFKTYLLSFERRYSKDKRPDFKKCLRIYLKNKERNKGQSSAEEVIIDPPVDEILAEDSQSHALVCIEHSGKQLLETIEATMPKLDECIMKAEKNDMKEFVKGKIEEEGQQGLLSKFSAPGKYRRNMKQLGKQRKLLDEIKAEIKLILSIIEQGKNGQIGVGLSVDNLNNDEDIHEQDTKPEDDTDATTDITVTVEIDESLPVDMPPINIHVNEVDIQVEEADGVIPYLIKAEKEQTPDKYAHDTEIAVVDIMQPVLNRNILNISQISESEKADVILPLRPSSPSLMNGKVSDSWETLEDGKMVSYGSYLVLNPSGSDDAPIMRRSRSLDSLSSLGSRRSMSRYGSYEFVTDYEIKIADKSEAEKARKM